MNVRSVLRTKPQMGKSGYCDLGQFERGTPVHTRVITITRGDAGPLNPKVVSVKEPGAMAKLREIERGEHYELDITLSPPWPRVSKLNSVTLETGVEQQPRETIGFKAVVTRRLTAYPARFNIPPGVTSALELTARLEWSSDAPPGRVLEASVNAPGLTVTVEERDGKQIIVLQVPANCRLARPEQARVTLETDDPERPELRLPVYQHTRRRTRE